jgi:hypothetical protein
MAQQAGLPGSHPVTMPNRQASASSKMSDDAVPTMDPKDVSVCRLHKFKIYSNIVADFRIASRASASLEACRWISRGLCERYGEG